MLNTILLALSVSIDSLGIGITYGIKNTIINFKSKIILFAVSVVFIFCSFFLGKYINAILSTFLTKILSSCFLIIFGIIMFINPISFDFDNSKAIDIKEAFFLATYLSLDSVCVGICISIGELSNFSFPIIAASFQLIFLSIGTLLGEKIIKSIKMPDKFWNIFSSGIIIIFGIMKFWI